MAATDTDGEVIVSSLERPERFEAIFERHAASVHRYLRRRVGETLAEELTAETFTHALRFRERFDADYTSALPWLYGIAVNLIRMHLRAENRRQRAYRLLAHSHIQPATTAEADARVDAQALGPALNVALRALTPEQREVLLLHAWAGLSPFEIAQALSISSATARKRLHRARAKAAAGLERAECEAIDPILETRTAR